MSEASFFHRVGRNGHEHVRTIEPELLQQELLSNRRITILDVRSSEDFHGPGGRIRGAHSIPLHQLLARRDEVASAKREPVVVVSRRGISARLAGLELEFAGFTEVQSLDGGMTRWIELGLPVEHSTPSTRAT